MLEKVINTIDKYNMLSYGDKVVVGVSGGPDSLALLYVLNRLKEKYNLKLFVAHVNHCLRGKDADDDEYFVKNVCEKLNIPFFVKREDVKEYSKKYKISLEEAGRNVRYSFFNEIFLKYDANKIAIAHNMNDNVETFFFNVIRGCGLEGICGINPMVNNVLIRPLIEISRDDIEKFCSDNELNPRIDKTNFENDYTRNKIRNLLLPFIKDNFNSNIFNTVGRTIEILNSENDYLQGISEYILNEGMEKYDDKICLDINYFNSAYFVIKARIVRYVIKALCGDTRNIEKKHIDKIIEIAKNKKTNTKIDLPNMILVEVQYDKLVFRFRNLDDNLEDFYYNLDFGVNFIPELNSEISMEIFESFKIDKENKYICVLDFDKISNNIDKLVVRNRRTGDRFNPIGMSGSKKLKDYFIDKKIPVCDRDKMPLVVIENEIVWVVQDKISDKYKVDENTCRFLVFKYKVN